MMVLPLRMTVRWRCDEGDVERLPFADGLLGGDGRGDAAVERAHVVRVERLAKGLGNLHFIDAAQVDAAVAVFLGADFELEIEVLELGVGAQVAVVFAFHHAVHEHAILHAPAVVGIRA